MRILVVEDDQTIALGLRYALEGEGYQAALSANCAQARQALAAGDIALGLVDVMLPDGSGYDLCPLFQAQGIPFLFLTACDEEVNVVLGLDMGADDYISKPFRVRELLSRIRSVLRRSGQGETPGVAQAGPVAVHLHEARVFKAGREVALTALEYRLLLSFVQHPGQVLTRGQLLEGIWDAAGSFVNDNTLTVYIKRLRDKLEDDPQHPKLIQTVRQMGYRWGE